MGFFVTETDKEYANVHGKKVNFYAIGAIMLISLLGLFVSWGFFLLIAFCLLIGGIIFMLSKNSKPKYWRLFFYDNGLQAEDLTTLETFRVEIASADDIVITQNAKEAEKDLCGIMIRGTSFAFCGIKHCAMLKDYINQNYN